MRMTRNEFWKFAPEWAFPILSDTDQNLSLPGSCRRINIFPKNTGLTSKSYLDSRYQRVKPIIHSSKLNPSAVGCNQIFDVAILTFKLTCSKRSTNYATTTGNTARGQQAISSRPLLSMCSAWFGFVIFFYKITVMQLI